MSLFEGVKRDVQFSHQDSMDFQAFHGCYCDIAEAPFEERKRLIDIRNSVKQVENLFMNLQRMSCWQQMDRQAAFTSLEERRLNLLAKVAEYKGRRALDVVTELNSCFGNENNIPFTWDFKERLNKKAIKPGASNTRFLTNCLRKLFISSKWQRAVGIAVKLVMVSASIASVMAAYHTSSTKTTPFLVSTQAGKSSCVLTISNSKSPLDVFCGRG